MLIISVIVIVVDLITTRVWVAIINVAILMNVFAVIAVVNDNEVVVSAMVPGRNVTVGNAMRVGEVEVVLIVDVV